jgi:ABC-type transport system involved in multi-copper enzyme maturation permease subunit
VTWVSWRLQRTETLIALGILALLAALLVPTGIQMANAYHQDGLAACLAPNSGQTCGVKIGQFQMRFQALTTLGNWLTLIPGLIGVLLAAPFILDLENGTYRLAWTQSITRGRWLLGKLGLPVVAAVLAAGALILLLTWWRTPIANLNGRLNTGIYDTEGTVVIGYTLFALALALALGAIWRRAATSLAVAFVGYFAVRIFVDYALRDHLVAPLKATYKGAQQPNFLYNAHVMSINATIHGKPITSGTGVGGFLGGGGTHVQVAPGISKAIFHVVYQPESHFWPLQLTETGLFIGLAAVLIVFAAWWTKERTA